MLSRLRKRTPEIRRVECPSCGRQQELDKGVLSAFCKHCHRRLSADEASGSAIPSFRSGDAPMTEVACPQCGAQTPVSKSAINAKCRHCHALFPLQKGRPVVRHSRGGRVEGPRALMFRCYSCGAELTAAEEALSTMCPKCGQRVELRDLEVTGRRRQDVFTCGRVVIGPEGVVQGTVNGREIVIEGEVRGQVISGSSLTVGSTGRCYADVVARALTIEKGAVLVGPVKVNEELLNQQSAR